MSTECPSAQVPSLEHAISTCAKCLDLSVVEDWLPISYFGDYKNANAWVLAINPSAREFLDRQDRVLTGDGQRFRRLADFPPVSQRTRLDAEHVSSVLAFQDSIFERVPYKPYFNRLGRFISEIHAADSGGDPLTPFKKGVTTKSGRSFRYAHLDIVKCATRQPWSKLSESQTRQLMDNCLPFLEEQLRLKQDLELILLNGRTALEHCSSFFNRQFGFDPQRRTLDLGQTSCTLWTGDLQLSGRKIPIVGWSANVVNSHLHASSLDALSEQIRAEIRAL